MQRVMEKQVRIEKNGDTFSIEGLTVSELKQIQESLRDTVQLRNQAISAVLAIGETPDFCKEKAQKVEDLSSEFRQQSAFFV